MTKRISLEVSNELYEQLEELKRARGGTMADVFRRAIGTETFFDKQVRGKGNKILLEDENHKLREIVWERG